MKALYDFVNPENPLSTMRLDISLNHIKKRSEKRRKSSKRTEQLNIAVNVVAVSCVVNSAMSMHGRPR